MKFLNMRRIYMAVETAGEVGGSGAPAPTPVAESAAPVEQPEAKPAEKPTEVKPTESPEKVVDKSKLSRVSGLVEAAGLTMKEVAEYAKSNDGKVDFDTHVALVEKHGEAVADLIVEQIKGIHTERSAEASKRDQAVFDQVAEAFEGITTQTGEETWKELAGWAKENVSDEHRAEINKLLAQGGFAAKLAVQELTTAFKEAQGNREFQDAELLEADVPAKGDNGLITKSDYNRELNKLLSAGHVYGESSEIKKLDTRRTKSIHSGY